MELLVGVPNITCPNVFTLVLAANWYKTGSLIFVCFLHEIVSTIARLTRAANNKWGMNLSLTNCICLVIKI